MTDPTPQTTPTRDEAVLLPCPFCGGPAKTLRYNGAEQATCAGTFSQCAGFDVMAPIVMWNKRPAPAPASGGLDAVAVLSDPVAVHMNMLRGSIAKPSLNNIAHLYPEVQRMKQALLATLKHFRWPTSAEHQTRDQVTAALAAFDDPPMTPAASLSPAATPVSEAGPVGGEGARQVRRSTRRLLLSRFEHASLHRGDIR